MVSLGKGPCHGSTELADLIHAPNHMHVLLVIRDTINPIAEKELGCPILSFEKQKTDH